MPRMRLCLATRNRHKQAEIAAVLRDLPIEIVSAADIRGCPDVEEDAPTLEGNAEKKARWVAAWTCLTTLADDTGLEVDALGGAPGVYSARWAGPGCTYSDNNHRLLRELQGVPLARRTARFRCVVAVAEPSAGAQSGGAGPAATAAGDRARLVATGEFAQRVAACRVQFFEGRIEGRILDEARGGSGFGYDPMFWIPEIGKTLAELGPDEKNRISHRARALAAARSALQEVRARPMSPGGAGQDP